MVEKLVIDNQELIVLVTLEDDDYGKVKKCFSGNHKLYVIEGKIVTDKETIKVLEDRYEVKIPEEWMNKN